MRLWDYVRKGNTVSSAQMRVCAHVLSKAREWRGQTPSVFVLSLRQGHSGLGEYMFSAILLPSKSYWFSCHCPLPHTKVKGTWVTKPGLWGLGGGAGIGTLVFLAEDQAPLTTATSLTLRSLWHLPWHACHHSIQNELKALVFVFIHLTTVCVLCVACFLPCVTQRHFSSVAIEFRFDGRQCM